MILDLWDSECHFWGVWGGDNELPKEYRSENALKQYYSERLLFHKGGGLWRSIYEIVSVVLGMQLGE